MRKAKKAIGRAAKGLSAAGIIGLALYIMWNHLGLIEGLDFGAGAYYYADIPEFSKYVNGSHYASQTPMWILILLFLIWGFLMYRLWIWLEKK
ncbi:MAG: hypothetical protein Q4C61_06425 [Lachnospiraceae bacterium]|nr:hypothetical protein [Lachnospiraceae bacterium]